MEAQITICITSCGRWDLLERTLKSLIRNWEAESPTDFFVFEDQNLTHEACQLFQESLSRLIIELNPNWPEVQVFYGRAGQIRAIDTLYAHLQTPYIFHCEDDWEFFKPGFIKPSIAILEENPKIMQVWIRGQNDRNGHPVIGQRHKTKSGYDYQILKTGYRRDWHGFSFNPGLRRVSDYENLFPNGYQEFAKFDPNNPLKSEITIGEIYMKAGFRAATLTTGHVKHIGTGRHVKLDL